jgi:hypothetical protein
MKMSQIEHSTENEAKRRSIAVALISIAAVVAVAIGGGIWWLIASPHQSDDFGTLLTSEEIPVLYQEFECPCCGQDIGSCTCGMALERQSAVNALVASGSTSSQLNLAMYTLYGEGIFFDQNLADQARAELEASLPADRPVLVVDPVQIDLGSIPIDGGQVSARYVVRNVGETDLIITGLQTSCGCTTAVLESGEGTSPVFGATAPEAGMEWSAVVPPGGNATVIATYDPLFHGDTGTGTFTRIISILSNDPLYARFELNIQIEVTE